MINEEDRCYTSAEVDGCVEHVRVSSLVRSSVVSSCSSTGMCRGAGEESSESLHGAYCRAQILHHLLQRPAPQLTPQSVAAVDGSAWCRGNGDL